jgi:hypothetical protein
MVGLCAPFRGARVGAKKAPLEGGAKVREPGVEVSRPGPARWQLLRALTVPVAGKMTIEFSLGVLYLKAS